MDYSKQASEVFDRLADLYQEKFMDVSPYASGLDAFLKLLTNADARILEIACGPGNITSYLLRQMPGLDILGIDLAPRMIELAKRNCPQASFEVMDCRQIGSLNTTFDGIVIGFCLPYLNRSELEQLVQDVSALLHTGGALYLSAIEGDYARSGYKKSSTGDEVFMHYYTLEDIQSLLEEAHLKVIAHNRVSVASNPHQDVDLELIAVKESQALWCFSQIL